MIAKRCVANRRKGNMNMISQVDLHLFIRDKVGFQNECAGSCLLEGVEAGRLAQFRDQP